MGQYPNLRDSTLEKCSMIIGLFMRYGKQHEVCIIISALNS